MTFVLAESENPGAFKCPEPLLLGHFIVVECPAAALKPCSELALDRKYKINSMDDDKLKHKYGTGTGSSVGRVSTLRDHGYDPGR